MDFLVVYNIPLIVLNMRLQSASVAWSPYASNTLLGLIIYIDVTKT